jgi:replicative DNA helicase
MGFAERQLRRRPKHTSALVLSMEMSLYASFLRTVQALTGIDGVRLREGDFSDAEYQRVLREWKVREDVPIYYNFASNFRLSQMRALIAEGIRRHNVGFVVIDHFRMIDPDQRYTNMNDADEAKVRFIKEGIAKDLNVAVMVLAHTSKIRERATGEQMRPRLSDLRGSGMISAFADQVALLWNPYKYATEDERLKRGLLPSMMDIDWSKNRFGTATVDHYVFDAATMRVRP